MAHSSDRLYSVALAISGFWTHLLVHGIIYTPGIFYVIFLQELQYDHAPQVALGTSLHAALVYGSGPICSVMIHSFGCRPVGVVGGFISGAGLILSVFNRHVYYMSVMFGVVTGVGMGMTYTANTVMISRHFTTYRSVALAIANSAIGLGTVAYPPLIRGLEEYYGWKGTLLIIGAISLNLVVCAAIYREGPVTSQAQLARNDENDHKCKSLLEKEKEEELYDSKSRKPNSWCANLKHAFADIQIFRNRGYVILCISMVLICVGLSSLYVHLAAFAEIRGVEANKSALLFSMIGLGNFCGQILTGALLQLPKCTGFMTLMAGFTNVGVMMMLLTVVHSYTLFLTIATAIGVGCGCFGSSLLDIIVRLLGVHMVNGGFGYVLLFLALGSAMGGPIAGIVYEATGQYTSSMYFGGSMLIIGGSLMLPELIGRCYSKNAFNTTKTQKTEIGAVGEEKM